MLHVSNLSIAIEQKNIVCGLSLQVAPGSIHALMGPNGSGKSTLAYTIAGHKQYIVTSGEIIFAGVNITELSPDKRARLGIFLAFQQPQVIPGVRILTFLHEAHAAVTGNRMPITEFQALLAVYMGQLSMDLAIIYRNVNEGFSGGEKKRLELLQLLVLKPKLVILDEIDSGLDIDALRIVAHGLQLARETNPDMSIIIITHYQRILNYIMPDVVHIVCDGVIVQSGDAAMVHALEKSGYDGYKK